jgi:glycosyltransferase involved in cell wall biosynthesis
MKIVFFSPYLPKHFGGGEKYLLDCAAIMAQAGHQVYVACARQTPISAAEASQIKQAYEDFFHIDLSLVQLISTPLFTSDKWYQKLWWTRQFDCLYYQTDGSLFFSLATENILHIQVPFTSKKSSWLERLKLSNYQIKNTNSHFTKQQIEKSWQTKIDFVHQPYVNLREFDKQKIEKENIILSVGRFFCQLHSKRQDVLVEMFGLLYKQLPSNWRLVLVGQREDEEFADRVHRLAKDLPIDFVHQADRDQLINYYQKASIYWHAAGYQIDEELNPEKVEHFGISTLEAMAAEAVPVVINKGGQKEILSPELESCLWNSKEDCLQKTLSLVKDSVDRQKLSTLAKKKSLEFSKKKFAKILIKMVEG